MASVQQNVGGNVGAFNGLFTSITTGSYGLGLLTESDSAVAVRTLGTFSKLSVRVSSSAGTAVWTLRVNSADGSESVSAAGTGSFTDVTNTDSPTAGQGVCVKQSAVSSVPSGLGIVFTASSDTVGRIGASSDSISANAGSTTFFVGFGGRGVGNTTEVNAQLQFAQSCTLQNLFVGCSVKGRSKSDTVTLRNNAANGNQTVTVSATGVVEDTTHTDSISTNGKVCLSVVTGSGTGTDKFSPVAIELLNSSDTFYSVCKNDSGGPDTFNFGSTGYANFSGFLNTTPTEASQTNVISVDGAVSNSDVNVTANTINGSTTFTLRQNSADTALIATIGSSTTGFVSDATHSVTVAVNDLLDWETTAAGSSGSATMQALTALFTISSGPTVGEMMASAMFGFIQPSPFRTQIVAY